MSEHGEVIMSKESAYTMEKGEVQIGQAENEAWQGQGFHLAKTSCWTRRALLGQEGNVLNAFLRTY